MSKLTVVVDNTVGMSRLAGEHGLSLWLEHAGVRVLYDTGAGTALMPNLERLGLDPAALDAVVLSHGHYDHTGGLAALLAARGGVTDLWCHPDVFAGHLHDQGDGSAYDIGPPLGRQEAYEKLGARFNFIRENTSPWPGITLLAAIARTTDFEGPAPGLVVRGPRGLVPDPFHDDLALLVAGDGGPVVLTGCAHAGVINVLRAAEELSDEPIAALVGGTHLGPAPPAQQARALEELAARPALHLVSGHCTGPAMNAILARVLGERFLPLAAGMSLEL